MTEITNINKEKNIKEKLENIIGDGNFKGIAFE